ncbi:ATP-binding cassette domain-containing protein [Desulfurococcus amylolyticus]|mgnify:FL=1|uniref:Molybdate/tungstate import ATP-binding protein WtpC n=1 Tax=Desulfurococcus amylolyticus (strain DSM 18924 / JCM 16383 / VKM B-2413 / 1221n) TaxID=490899 RepID=B8D2Z4_DESA1|nr:ATP-binding cassette domain-containing protein [Desulfurococcus amylolyticus]ACL10541.1 glycine betaine/carnitine/choline transport ATP-binding protein [Desulfurococcus amylolyticus 1221n]
MLEVNGLNKSFNGRQVNKDIGFKLEKGGIAVIIGPNASGKTTLLKSISGLIEPDSGVIIIDGETIYEKKPYMKKPRVNKPPYERNIGYVPSEPSLFPNLTLKGNIELPLKKRGWSRNDIERRVNELLEIFGLREYRDMYPGQLSNGLRQKASIARALSYNPSLLLLDEPLSPIDPVTRERLRNELFNLFNKLKVAVLLTTHLIEDILFFKERIIALVDGRIVYDGELSEHKILSSPYMLQALGFLVIPARIKKCNEGEALVAIDKVEKKIGYNTYASSCIDGRNSLIVVNPGYITLTPGKGDHYTLEASLLEEIDNLTSVKLVIDIWGRITTLTIPKNEWSKLNDFGGGKRILLYMSREHTYLIDQESG